ncbi:GlcNAc-PI de-N-acetylase [Niastella yeongjuensis]|uniref:GlcNAc-PI de-N-acetylase n=1 Tax=Niastella yeongjuensis TaxID=354355 RepID=A0A1V9F0Y5_9BACT|nr:PIG-L family deacetylase [Niastella yeongjuensis]OQP52043.1 GlcNAc-PI de-N-acetylase [Niastella yeongjuensis]SEP36933.1 GlcNAc-PI de-N-acetylase [Niastella yeongjuensis]
MNEFYSGRFLILLALLYVLPVSAQTPPSYTSADIFLQLKKLKVLGSVLYMAAHPDDENTRLLAWLARERLYRTGYLSLTRGDGGQNLIGDEQGIDLGLIRTQELLAARRTDGAEQFFSRAFDFGFSKSTDEALEKWGKEKVLSDAVWIIRKFQPDIIITRFPEDSRAGHGHHSASAVIAHEAFKAAADPNRFPEQFKYGVQPWKVKRIFWNTFNFGSGTNTTSNDQLKIDVGGYNALVGKSYGEIAAESRSMHKSQGFGVPGSRGTQLEYFSLTEGEPIQNDLMDGVNVSWSKVEGGAAIEAQIDDLLKNYSLAEPQKSVPALVNLYKSLQALKEGYWKKQKTEEVQRLIEACSGLWLEASTGNEMAVEGDSVRISIAINNRLGVPMQLSKINLDVLDTTINMDLDKNRNINLQRTFYVFTTKPVSQPYWLEHKMGDGSFTVDDQQLIGKPQNDAPYQARFDVVIAGTTFSFTKPVLYKHADPVKGELYEPLVVVPSSTVTTEPSIIIFRKGEKQAAEVEVTVTANKKFTDYKARISKRLTYNNTTKTDSNFNMLPGMQRQYMFNIDNGMLKEKEQDFVQAFVELKNGTEEQPAYLNLNNIRYDHIPYIHYFYQDAVKVLNIDIKTVGKKIGYIEGAGDKVIIALRQMGYEVTVLEEKDLTPFKLSQFDAVITGVRAYNVHDYLEGKHAVLMDYVKNGGNLIVQYNTANNISSVTSKIGPYQFAITRNRVTDEKATVNFELPNHAVLNYPNKITAKDFENWVQERGIYFAEQLDSAYETPLSMADPNEKEQKGSLIVANYGKGKFVYTGLVFFRELPAGVPGAYRLLANIIALNKKKGF